VNLKLGGVNQYGGLPRAGYGIPLMQDLPTMVLGSDVHHPAPGSTKASYCAMVASLDKEVSSFYTAVNEQPSRTEVMPSLEENVVVAMRRFGEANDGVLPRRLIFYRDGVAHNQFGGEGPVQQEIGLIFRACRAVCGDKLPELVYVVVQKRNRARMATSGNNQKLQPGTVVDTDITEAGAYDFYLCPHYGLKGTPAMSHFHVVYDDARLSADELQQFTFQMCHMYGRATKIVSRPAPVYYAHLAAYHASFYKKGYKEDGDAWEVATVSSGGSDKSTSSCVEVHDTLKNRLHYV
jgi:eukaryotic translation initiation factor 2C